MIKIINAVKSVKLDRKIAKEAFAFCNTFFRSNCSGLLILYCSGRKKSVKTISEDYFIFFPR